MAEVGIPAFAMDCRDWIVMQVDDAELALDEDGAPVVARLSTLLVADDVQEATGSITLGLLDHADDLAELEARPVAPGAAAQELLEHDPEPGTRKYVVPAPGDPDQPRLALLAEFTVPTDAPAELDRRVSALMGSFRWQAA